jgi:hypothetical protein
LYIGSRLQHISLRVSAEQTTIGADKEAHMQPNQPYSPQPPPAPPRPPTRVYQKYQAQQQLQQAIDGAHEVLFTASTVFPFTLFPDTVTLDRTKLTITHRSFFKVAEAASLRVEDILNVSANVGPFFGSIKVTTRFFDPDKTENKLYVINYLKREDALRLKRIVQGYIIATRQKIDCSALSTHELAALLGQLGEGMS